MWIITKQVGGFTYYIQDRGKTPLYGHSLWEWNGLINNAKEFPSKQAAERFNQNYHCEGEVKPLKP